MLLWIILACLTAIVLLVLLRPLASVGSDDRSVDAFDSAVYRDQLGEIDRDRARGLIGEEEAEAARVEIARRLLAADSKAEASAGISSDTGRARAATIAVAVALPLLALGLYIVYGSPRFPAQPLAARLQDPSSDQNLEALVARVETRLREHPEEGEGWDVIAPVYMGWQRYADAADAYAQAIRLLGESAKRLSGQGQALVLANNGVVTEEARRALERAVALDQTLLEPRILLAIAKEQDGQFQAAIEDWRALLDNAPKDAPWREMVEKKIVTAEAHLAGKPMTEAEGSTSQQLEKVPGDADLAASQNPAAQNMNLAERQAMIETMVQRLATKLDQDGGDLAGWLKLVRAYSVLERKADALKAFERAKSQFSGDAEALQQLDALAAELGLKS